MPKEDTIKLEGTVEELLPNMTFRVTLENGMTVHAHLCGKMRMRNIRVFVGDTVKVGDCLMILEAMKMQHELIASIDGSVVELLTQKGKQVSVDELLIEINPSSPEK